MNRIKRLVPATIIPPHLYVRREADRQVMQNIQSMGRPGYILVSRQMGKTNLLIQTKRDLEKEQQLFGYVDLSNKLPTSRDCFRNIVDSVINAHSSTFTGVKSSIVAMREKAKLAPSKEFESEILCLLEAVSGKIIIILDEIDALIDTDYSDEIFAQIRSVYFNRVNYQAFERLTFLLSGVAEPATLIKDRTKSPFNIGEKIYLDDFSPSELDEFLQKAELTFATDVRTRIYEWTGGHPRMTWELCSALEDLELGGQRVEPAHVDDVVQRLYLDRFDLPPVDHIRDLVRSDKSILRSVKQLNHDPRLQLSDHLRKKLFLAGIIASDSSSEPLRIKNKIIEASLSDAWLDNMESFGLALVFMGDEQAGLRNYGAAIKHYTEFLQREDTTDPKVRSSILAKVAYCYKQLQDWDKALEIYEECQFEKEESTAEYYNKAFNVGVCLFAKQEFGKASDLFEKLLQESKRGIYRWKACVNYAGTLIKLERPDADSKAVALYKDVIAETEEFEDVRQENKELQTLSSYNLGEIFSRTGALEDAKSYYEKATRTANKEFTPYLLLSLAEAEVEMLEKLRHLKRAVDIIIKERLVLEEVSTDVLITPNMAFSSETLRNLLLSLLDCQGIEEFNRLAQFTLTHYLQNIPNSLDLIIWSLSNSQRVKDHQAVIRRINYGLKNLPPETPSLRKSLMNAHRIISAAKRNLKQPFFEDLRIFVREFG